MILLQRGQIRDTFMTIAALSDYFPLVTSMSTLLKSATRAEALNAYILLQRSNSVNYTLFYYLAKCGTIFTFTMSKEGIFISLG